MILSLNNIPQLIIDSCTQILGLIFINLPLSIQVNVRTNGRNGAACCIISTCTIGFCIPATESVTSLSQVTGVTRNGNISTGQIISVASGNSTRGAAVSVIGHRVGCDRGLGRGRKKSGPDPVRQTCLAAVGIIGGIVVCTGLPTGVTGVRSDIEYQNQFVALPSAVLLNDQVFIGGIVEAGDINGFAAECDGHLACNISLISPSGGAVTASSWYLVNRDTVRNLTVPISGYSAGNEIGGYGVRQDGTAVHSNARLNGFSDVFEHSG